MGKNYTAEEYREVLTTIYNIMGSKEREIAFGVNETVLTYMLDTPASELIEKYRTYINTPKMGEYWKRKENGEMVVIWRIEKDTVHVYYCDGGCCDLYSLEYFTKCFTKTEHKSQYLELLLKEMEDVNK